jgi:Cft2 family RNA processing exonuclease
MTNPTFTAISGLGKKEPAAFLVEAGGVRLLLDCGEGPEPGILPDFERIGQVDAVILSHGHGDHSGGLKHIARIGSPPVYATAAVLARLKMTIDARPLPPRGKVEVLGIEIETGRSGHALGGIWLRLAIGGGLLYMGDHSDESAVYAFDPPPPSATLILDASYGAAAGETQEAQRQAIAAIAARGPLLLPVPPDGRGPEIALFLHGLRYKVRLDCETRAAVRALTATAADFCRPGAAVALAELEGEAEVLDADAAPQGVMLAHDAVGKSGTSQTLIERWREKAAPAIIFTGHVAPATPGRDLLQRGRAQFQRWNVHPTFAENAGLARATGATRLIGAFGGVGADPAWRRLPGAAGPIVDADSRVDIA